MLPKLWLSILIIKKCINNFYQGLLGNWIRVPLQKPMSYLLSHHNTKKYHSSVLQYFLKPSCRFPHRPSALPVCKLCYKDLRANFPHLRLQLHHHRSFRDAELHLSPPWALGAQSPRHTVVYLGQCP